MQLDLKRKNALVCGSTQGIGRAAAIALADAGANVTLVARNEERLMEAKLELPIDDDQRHGVIVADFQDPFGLAKKVEAELANVAAFHILVNNTGGPPGGEILAANLDEFRKIQ